MSPTMTEGKIARWAVKEGEKIHVGQVLLEVETDKAVIEVEAPENGVLAKILATPSTGSIPVGHVIAVLAEEGEDWKNVKIPTQTSKNANPPPPSSPAAPSKPVETTSKVTAATVEKPASPTFTTTSPLSPAVANLVARYHLDAAVIPATGPRNRLLKGDVLSYLEGKPAPQKAAAAPEAPKTVKKPTSQAANTFNDKPASAPRKVMAQNYVKGKGQLPHHYLSADCDLDAIPGFQKYLADSQKTSVSTLEILAKAAAVALRQIPEANAIWGGEDVKLLDQVNISVVVDTKEGPRFPLLQNANQLGLLQISEKLKKAVADAPQLPEAAGSFRISDFGSTGVTNAAEILDTVSTSALSISSPKKQPKILEDGTLKFSTVATLTLSTDARAVDPEIAERFLLTIQQLLASPTTLI